MVTNVELKEKVEEHNELLKNHDERLRILEINKARTEEIISNLTKNHKELKSDIQELRNTTLNTNNAVLNSINQLIIARDNNDTQKNINKNTNITQIIKQFLVTISAIVVGIAGYIKFN